MKKFGLILAMIAVGTSCAMAQGASACPGLKNPASFTSGATTGTFVGYYSGQTGSKPNQTPNPLTGITGMNMTSPIIPASQLATTASSGSSSCNGTLNPQNRFRIMSSTEGPGTGNQRGKDPLVGYNLPYVPTAEPGEEPFTKAIRVGNCITGAEAEALFYNMRVRTQNALLFIYYSIVVQAPGHGTGQDPTFVIRVCRPVGSGASTTYQQISDTLCYAVSSTPASQGGSVVIGQNGWHAQGSIYYRDWNKVAINLNKYLYENVRIEIYMGDCSQHGHYGYCYIAGDCQPMQIKSSGCPKGATSVLDTLRAPKGLMNYVWYRSDVDGNNIDLMAVDPTINFVRVSGETSTNNEFLADTSHFRVHLVGSQGQDSVGLTNVQVFRCDMTSAMDPAKPFISRLYAKVDNTKPMVSIDSFKTCESYLSLINKSFVPNKPNGCDTTYTKWWFYEGSTDQTPVRDSFEFNPAVSRATFGKVHYAYDPGTTGPHAVKVRSFGRNETGPDLECYTDQTFRITVLGRPTARLGVSTHDLCDSDRVTLTDLTDSTVRRDWIFSNSVGGFDTIRGRRHNAPLTYIRGFEEEINTVGLISYNKYFCTDSINTYDTTFCSNTVYDTIRVFSHPTMLQTGDSIVCQGDKTDITVTALTDSCTYQWYRTLYGTSPIAAGKTLRVAPYADTCTYYVKVTSPKQCVAWDSVHAYMVIPNLRIDKHVFCAGDSVTLVSGAADHYSWSASPDDPSLDALLDSNGFGPSVITVKPSRNTTYTLIGHGTNGCSASPLTESVDVHQLPVARVSFDPKFIDSDRPVVTFSDVSPNSVSSEWHFPNEELPVFGNPVTHDFGEVSDSTVPVRLVAANDLGCTDSVDFYVPVVLFTFYAPNVFSPDRADNNRFMIFTTNEMEHFHITIYDRRGQMVYKSDDLHFEWDGNSLNGDPCPQGSYVYVATYRRPMTEDIVTQKGTVTIIR